MSSYIIGICAGVTMTVSIIKLVIQYRGQVRKSV